MTRCHAYLTQACCSVAFRSVALTITIFEGAVLCTCSVTVLRFDAGLQLICGDNCVLPNLFVQA